MEVGPPGVVFVFVSCLADVEGEGERSEDSEVNFLGSSFEAYCNIFVSRD